MFLNELNGRSLLKGTDASPILVGFRVQGIIYLDPSRWKNVRVEYIGFGLESWSWQPRVFFCEPHTEQTESVKARFAFFWMSHPGSNVLVNRSCNDTQSRCHSGMRIPLWFINHVQTLDVGIKKLIIFPCSPCSIEASDT